MDLDHARAAAARTDSYLALWFDDCEAIQKDPKHKAQVRAVHAAINAPSPDFRAACAAIKKIIQSR